MKDSLTTAIAPEQQAEDRVPSPDLSFTEEEKELIASIRRQCDAKAAAELLLGLDVRPKQIRGRACLFVGLSQTTFYTGYTWAGAVARLIYLRKKEAAEAPALKADIARNAPADPPFVRKETL